MVEFEVPPADGDEESGELWCFISAQRRRRGGGRISISPRTPAGSATSSPSATWTPSTPRRPPSSSRTPRSTRTSASCWSARTSTPSSTPRPTTGTRWSTSPPCKAGKDVYSEKPLTLTIDEGKRLVAAVRESRPRPPDRQPAAQRPALPPGLRAGPQRPARQADADHDDPPRRAQSAGRSSRAAVPTELDWDFWQGQAPALDYVPERCHLWFRYW